MDKTAIKNFAVWARVRFMEDIRTRLGLLGITENGISDPLPASTSEVQYFDIGADCPVAIRGTAILQREKLAEEIRKAAKDSDTPTAFRNFIEASAYDWFNRLIAIRYMEVNEYAPLDMRLLSSVEPGKQDPDLVSTPFDGSVEFTESETQQILAWKEQHDNDRLFRFLLLKMCNELHEVLPGIFEGKDDASELLMQQSFIDKDGVIHHLVTDIPEEDWKDQVQIIGWIYQYYNTELKDETFKLLKKNVKITKERIPSATQLFTPDWIVRYMVENSLGRLWIEHLRGLDPDVDEKETAEKFGWKYYLPEAKQEPEVEQQLVKIREEYAALKPEDLTCLDPCMGSGHILVYMFDVLEQIYTSVGYSEREAAKAILENNIYGLDIDDRAYQLAYFAVMMKARQYNRRILTSGVRAHVYSIQESNGITENQLQETGESLSPEEKSIAYSQAEQLVGLFHDAKEYGSILNIPEMDWDLLRRFAKPEEKMGQTSLNWNQEASERLMQLIDQGQVMAKKYWVTCSNPPYAVVSGLDAAVNCFIKGHYPESKTDLFAVFIEKCNDMLKPCGYQAMITQHAWMFLASYENLRDKLLNEELVNLIHLGPHAFNEINGEVVQTASFVFCKVLFSNYNSIFLRLIDGKNETDKESEFVSRKHCFIMTNTKLRKIKGAPYTAYWASDIVLSAFNDSHLVGEIADPRVGMATANNDRFVRLWFEVDRDKFGINLPSRKEAIISHKKWFPFSKGGEQRKWYGNNDAVVNWENDGFEIQNYKDEKTGRIRSHNYNLDYIFSSALTWTVIGTEKTSFRFCPIGFLYSNSGYGLFCNNDDLKLYLLGFMNSKVAASLLRILSPSMGFESGYIRKLPLIGSTTNKEIIYIVNNTFPTNETISTMT